MNDPATGVVEDLHPNNETALRAAGALLEVLGHPVSEVHPAVIDEADQVGTNFMITMSIWATVVLDGWNATISKEIREADVEVMTWAMATIGRACSAPQYLAASEWLNGFTPI